MSRRLLLCSAATLVGFTATAQSQSSPPWAKTLGYRSEEIFPIRVGRYGYPYVSILVNGQKVEMPFDTGNMSGLAVSTRVAQRLKLPSIGSSPSLDTRLPLSDSWLSVSR